MKIYFLGRLVCALVPKISVVPVHMVRSMSLLNLLDQLVQKVLCNQWWTTLRRKTVPKSVSSLWQISNIRVVELQWLHASWLHVSSCELNWTIWAENVLILNFWILQNQKWQDIILKFWIQYAFYFHYVVFALHCPFTDTFVFVCQYYPVKNNFRPIGTDVLLRSWNLLLRGHSGSSSWWSSQRCWEASEREGM